MLAQADKLSNGKAVKGSYINDKKENQHRILIEHTSQITQIEPQTLKYSFDDGESWYSETKIKLALRMYYKKVKGTK